MTNSDENQPAAERAQPEQATARILQLLDKLAAAEGLGNAASATGFTEDQLRSSLREAAQIIRKNQGDLVKKRWPLLGSLLGLARDDRGRSAGNLGRACGASGGGFEEAGRTPEKGRRLRRKATSRTVAQRPDKGDVIGAVAMRPRKATVRAGECGRNDSELNSGS